jgi:hypothetical protein
MTTQEAILCPKCGFQQRESSECMKCGIVFAKFDPARHLSPPNDSDNAISLSEAESIERSADRWMHGSGKYALIALMGFFFFYMVIKRSGWCFLDYVNLPFHEFGHILFTPFGNTMHFLGGTLGQLMWPFILLFYFLYRKEYLSSSFCLFWFGENFLNISKYMADARELRLPLVGGGIHDWNYLFYKWGILHLDKSIAGVIFTLGVIIMTGSIVWAVSSRPKDSCKNHS